MRFLLQEFDLPPGETLLGRSPECHVTIEDPLVSRRHAKITIRGDKAIVHDLGSRNGLRVNGQPLPTGQAILKDGDRLRVGTQELVFCVVAPAPEDRSKQTGFLRHCARCKTPYPEEMLACPSCGANEFADDETLTGAIGNVKRNWTLQLLVEVLERAQSMGRDDEAERILRRASAHLDEVLQTTDAPEQRQIDAIAECAAKLAVSAHSSQWAQWLLMIYAKLKMAPPVTVIDRLRTLEATQRAKLQGFVVDLLQAIRGQQPPVNAESISRLETLLRELEA
ncbi:MAG: FHA domain-containing protein [Polyangiaceae bacterium]